MHFKSPVGCVLTNVCNHHPCRGTKRFHHQKKGLSSYCLARTTSSAFYKFDLSFLEFVINRIAQHVSF